MSNKNTFHAPLKLNNTETQTMGCHHTNPDICSKNMMSNICAYVREGVICMKPLASWKKQYHKLIEK